MDKAGAYGIQVKRGLLERVEGSYSNVVGWSRRHWKHWKVWDGTLTSRLAGIHRAGPLAQRRSGREDVTLVAVSSANPMPWYGGL